MMQKRLKPAGKEKQPALTVGAAEARILVVDDDERNLLVIGEVLEGIGNVVCAKSGEEALRFLLKEKFAVILLDVLMPGLDGYETAALIRKREQSKNTPIIFLTAINKEDAHMLRGYDAGAVDYVFKPFDPVMLRSKVSVFVELYEKTAEIERKAEREQRLFEEALRAQSEKLLAERALRNAEAREDAILASLPVCFHARASEPPFAAKYLSKGVKRLTGFPAESFLSDPNFGLSRIHPEDLESAKEALKTARETGAYTSEFRWQCADGEYRTFLDQGVVSKNGATEEILGTMLDVTEQRGLENQLLQARRLDAIGKLTGGLAHDFNNLLAAILSGLGLIERGAILDEKAVHILEMTRRSAKQGADLVNRMLAFSRRQNLRPVAVELLSLGDTVNGLVAPILGGLVRFEWQVGAEVWPIYADQDQLDLALMNLIFNARDAMPSGGTVSVRAENRPLREGNGELPPGDYVMLAVEDTGSGIAPEILAKVIEPFFTTKALGKGTGLGLSTVYGFTKQSGGMLRIDSEVGRGTVMELWLPRAGDGILAADTPRTVGASFLQGNDSLPTVLLVDDSQELREITAISLGQLGFEVTVAAGGAEALGMIEKEPDKFDIIVTDFAMPLVSGVDVIRFARNLRAGWPAIIVTGYADLEKIIDRPLDVPLLTKPFLESDLAESIRATSKRAKKAGKTQRQLAG
jgi:signal transduction histidine kinase/DNA-binding response OmpR family regulator